jgi:Tol biopolymer transport system component
MFVANRKGPYDLYQKACHRRRNRRIVAGDGTGQGSNRLVARGRLLLYRSVDPKTGYDIWALPINGDRKPYPVVQTNFDERDAQFSPDGKWIAYQSNESGRFRDLHPAVSRSGSKLQVSTNGGAQVRWGVTAKNCFTLRSTLD